MNARGDRTSAAVATDRPIRIEKGIKIPAFRRQQARISYPFADMEVGNSFMVPAATPADVKRVQHAVYQQSVRFRKQFSDEYKFTCRRVDGGVRCWRTK